MRLRFRGDGDEDRETCLVFGLTFPVGEWVELSDPPRKLLSNPMFETDGEPSKLRRVKRGDGDLPANH